MSQSRSALRLVVLGRGAAGKSTFAKAIGDATGVRATELDSLFWSPDAEPLPPADWVALQQQLTSAESWILDGDLGPYDAVFVRLAAADTVVLFDLPTWRCGWRALRRGRERRDFWAWLLTWRRRYRSQLLAAIAQHAPDARLVVVQNRADLRRATAELTAGRSCRVRPATRVATEPIASRPRWLIRTRRT